MDEATSALDTESEKMVQQALENATNGCTAIIIAHRLSTIQNADIVAVVNDGRVNEIGSQDELLQNENGLYSSLVRLQQTNKSKAQLDETVTATFTNEDTDITCLVDDPTSSAEDHISVRLQASNNNKNEEDEKQLNNTVSFWRLLLLNAPEWKQAVLGCLSAMVFGAVQPVYAFAMGSMISVYFQTDYEDLKNKIKIYSLCFLSLSLISLVVNVGQHYNFAYMGEYLTKRVRESMFSKMLTFEVGWFDREENSSGAICSRLANDANVVRFYFTFTN